MVILNIFLFVLLFLFLFLIKFVETSFVSMRYGDIREILVKDDLFKKILLKWIKSGNLMLASLQFIRYLIEISLILFLTQYTGNFFYSLLVSFFIFIVVGEYAPRTLAIQKGVKNVYFLFMPLYYLALFVSPFVRLFILPSDIIIKMFGGRMVLSAPYMTELEEQIIKNILDEDDAQERDMLNSILEFKDTIVREIMVPRVDIVAVPSDISYKELIDIIEKEGHSRLPVYDERLDNLLGIIYVKDLIKVDEKSFDIKKLLREPFFVPETKKINSLLKDFQTKHMHMAFVVDEYGDLVGLATIEDVLEEIVGEIEDEYDEEETLFTKIGEGEYIISPKMTIEEFNDTFNIDLEKFKINEDDDYDTIAGFLIAMLGTLPKKGDKKEFDTFLVKVMEADERRILKLYLKIKNKEN